MGLLFDDLDYTQYFWHGEAGEMHEQLHLRGFAGMAAIVAASLESHHSRWPLGCQSQQPFSGSGRWPKDLTSLATSLMEKLPELATHIEFWVMMF
jgi:hypothetical protein